MCQTEPGLVFNPGPDCSSRTRGSVRPSQQREELRWPHVSFCLTHKCHDLLLLLWKDQDKDWVCGPRRQIYQDDLKGSFERSRLCLLFKEDHLDQRFSVLFLFSSCSTSLSSCFLSVSQVFRNSVIVKQCKIFFFCNPA